MPTDNTDTREQAQPKNPTSTGVWLRLGANRRWVRTRVYHSDRLGGLAYMDGHFEASVDASGQTWSARPVRLKLAEGASS